MKLFIERLLSLLKSVLGFVASIVFLFIGAVVFASLPEIIINVFLLVIASIASLSLIFGLCMIFHWLIIEPFFTKKGADRK